MIPTSPSAPSLLTLDIPNQDVERARIALDAGNHAACAALCEEMMAAGNDHPVLQYMLGISLFRLGKLEIGAALVGAAAERQPTNLLLRIDHANSLAAIGLVPAAIQVLIDGIKIHGPHPEIAQRLALLFSDTGQHHKAQLLLVSSIAANPSRVELCCLLAAELASELKTNEAITLMELSAILCGDNPGIHSSLAVLEQARGNLDSAIHHYQRAIELVPDQVLAHANLATALLTRHDYDNGFREAEWRLKTSNMRIAHVPAPRWTGESLVGKRLLVTAEQGFGDMIQYSRFLAALKDCGGEVTLEIHHGLERLLAPLPGVSRCISLVVDEAFPPTDYTIPLISLPLVVGCRKEWLEQSVPYIATPSPMGLRGEGLRVGMAWASRPAFGEVYSRRMLNRRSCTLQQISQLAELSGLSLFSLQKGDAAIGLEGITLPITDLSPRLRDFQETAAAIAALDLVVTVDTSVAHLAAAMGRPVWIMLAPGQIDYRWGTEGSSSWYPHARLYRGGAGGWAGLIRQISTDLRAVIAGELALQWAK